MCRTSVGVARAPIPAFPQRGKEQGSYKFPASHARCHRQQLFGLSKSAQADLEPQAAAPEREGARQLQRPCKRPTVHQQILPIDIACMGTA